MNALNHSIQRAPSPLVWRANEHVYGWVESGLGFALDTRVGKWTPIVDAALCTGRVLSLHERLSLVITFGRPNE